MTITQKRSPTGRSDLPAIQAATLPATWTHVPALDGLRAAAVIAVLLFHAGHLQGGFLGVDLFFALSGFLITSLLIRDSDSGGIKLSEFWGRRSPPTRDDARNVELDRLTAVARAVADTSVGRIVFIDACEAWVSPPVRDSNGDGAPERKDDLIHVCPAGAAGFGAWLANELSLRFDGLAPADPASWALGDWVTEPRYDEPVGACAPVG